MRIEKTIRLANLEEGFKLVDSLKPISPNQSIATFMKMTMDETMEIILFGLLVVETVAFLIPNTGIGNKKLPCRFPIYSQQDDENART